MCSQENIRPGLISSRKKGEVGEPFVVFNITRNNLRIYLKAISYTSWNVYCGQIMSRDLLRVFLAKMP